MDCLNVCSDADPSIRCKHSKVVIMRIFYNFHVENGNCMSIGFIIAHDGLSVVRLLIILSRHFFLGLICIIVPQKCRDLVFLRCTAEILYAFIQSPEKYFV